MGLSEIRSDWTHWALIILGLSGFGLVWLSTSTYGPGISPDSIQYIHAARSVMAGDGYLAFGGSPYVGWPPLFPSALAVLGKIGIEPLDGARVLNAIVFGLTIYSAGHLLRTHLQSAYIVVAATATLLASITLVRISIMAWSEPLFVFLAVLFVIFLSRFIRERRLTFFLIATACSSLAMLDRYIGFTLAITGSVSILWLMTTLAWHRRLIYVGFFGAVSLTPLMLWLVRNQRLTDSFTGSRASPETGLFENLGNTLAEYSSWLLPSQYLSSSSFHTSIVALAVIALAASIGFLVWIKISKGIQEELLWLAPAGIFVLVYTGSLVAMASLVGFDSIGGRLLSPVYVFGLLFISVSIEESVKITSGIMSNHWLIERAILIGGVLLVMASAAIVFGQVGGSVCDASAQNALFLSRVCQADGTFQSWGSDFIRLTGLSTLFLGLAFIILRRKIWIGRVAISGIISFWLLYHVLQTGVYVESRIKSGAGGYNSDSWNESPLIQHLRLDPLNGAIYSNVPQLLYILTDTDNRRLPLTLPKSPAEFGAMSNEPAYLVWMDKERFDSSQSYQDAASRYTLIEQARFLDGGIFLIER